MRSDKLFLASVLAAMLAWTPAAATLDLHAVGRLNKGGKGFCTAFLVAPHIVLTAAHCVTRPRNKKTSDKVLRLSNLHFVAGWEQGEFVAHRQPKRVIIPPQYAGKPTNSAAAMRWDLAAIELAKPIEADAITPIEPATGVIDDNRFTTHQYRLRKPHRIQTQTDCVLGSGGDLPAGLFLTSCSATQGASGSPYLTAEGKLVGIVVGRTKGRGPNGRKINRAIVLPLRPELLVAVGLGVRASETTAPDAN